MGKRHAGTAGSRVNTRDLRGIWSLQQTTIARRRLLSPSPEDFMAVRDVRTSSYPHGRCTTYAGRGGSGRNRGLHRQLGNGATPHN
jgi:hypothetical protein